VAEPKIILQFGTGRFLRSFVDLFVHEANLTSDHVQKIVAVQSTGSERARQLDHGPFHVAIRGVSGGRVVDSIQTIESVQTGLAAEEDWDTVLEVSRDDSLQIIVSNTTEAGLSRDDQDDLEGVPRSYPAKLLSVLLARFSAGLSGLTILPCELVDDNAKVLRDLVLEQAVAWEVAGDAFDWVRDENRWCPTLVDRIVSAPTDSHPLFEMDRLLSVAEPFAFWAIESQDPVPIDHPVIQCVDDVSAFALRKVRILNGAHTALVEKAKDDFVTVREAMAHEETRDWLESVVTDEIVPCVEDRVEGASQFARDVFERFENPFLDHRLADIALHQAEKIKVRLLPTYNDYQRLFGKPPALLGQALSPHL
jgi:tagaturonate reductase